MSQQFNEVRVGTSARSTFDLSHHQVTTTDFGYIIPICVRDLVPNDDVVVKPSLFTRLAPLAFPVYGRITCRVHSFFVPYRLLFPAWTSFLTQSAGNNKIPPYFTVDEMKPILNLDPQCTISPESATAPRGKYARLMANLGLNPGIITGYFGLSNSERIAAWRWLAYYRIWMDWFMDSNIYDHSQMVSAFNSILENGGNIADFFEVFAQTRCACYGKDYFTTAKLHPQAGNASLVNSRIAFDSNPGLVEPSAGASYVSQRILNGKTYTSNASTSQQNVANLNIGEFTVEELRAAVSLQRYLERNNYVGTKVINQLLAHFGVAPTPERLDMSEYIGGSNFEIQIGDVTSTSANESLQHLKTIGLGAQAGKGIGAAQTETVRYHAKEHGVFMTVLSILPDTSYYQGLDKAFSLGVNGDALDFYTPEFENLGFQEILNKEVWVPNLDQIYGQSVVEYDPDGIFGYSPRYAFMKFQRDILAGDFVGRLASSESQVMGAQMDAWHLFRKLIYYTSDEREDPLALNENFVECNNKNTDFDRIFQVTDNSLDHFYFNIDVDVKATRDMVGFAEPSLDSVNSEDGNKINLPYGGTRL